MNASPSTVSSEARVQTALSRRYLEQLCKHFQHKLPVTLEDGHGLIAFPAGTCELDAVAPAGILMMRVVAGDEPGLIMLEDVVARHLQRFAFREELNSLDTTRLNMASHRASSSRCSFNPPRSADVISAVAASSR